MHYVANSHSINYLFTARYLNWALSISGNITSKTWLDPILDKVDAVIYKLCGIKQVDMNGKEYVLSLILTNAIMVLLDIFVAHSIIPVLNPNNISNMEATLSFNTIISFITNTNLQHYSGESGLSYLSQMLVIIFMMFTSAATGYAACMAFCRRLVAKTDTIGNFFIDFVRVITRILMPISIIVAIILVSQGHHKP